MKAVMNPARNQNIKLDKKPEDKKEVGLLISNGVNKYKVLVSSEAKNQGSAKGRFLFAISVILLGVFSRFFLNEFIAIPNFEMITALSLISGSLLGGIFAPLIPILIIFLSDIYFGNTIIYLFTWSAFALIGIFGIIFKRNSKHYYLKITGGGIVSVLFFYFWTNFGWWLVSGIYPLNFQGLIACYLAAIPFLKNQLMSVLIFLPAFALLFIIISEKFFANITKKDEDLTFISRVS